MRSSVMPDLKIRPAYPFSIGASRLFGLPSSWQGFRRTAVRGLVGPLPQSRAGAAVIGRQRLAPVEDAFGAHQPAGVAIRAFEIRHRRRRPGGLASEHTTSASLYQILHGNLHMCAEQVE